MVFDTDIPWGLPPAPLLGDTMGTFTIPREGGAAFPLHAGEVIADGMSLRDYFAGQAIVGSISRVAGPEWEKTASVVATQAYLIADALIAARAREPQGT